MIKVEITDPSEFHCFKLSLETPAGEHVEIYLHATALVELIREASMAYAAWMQVTSEHLICGMTGLTPDQARAQGLIAPLPEPRRRR